MRQMSARVQCFSGTNFLLGLYLDLPPPGFPIQSIPVCSTWPQGTGLVGEGFGEVQGGEGGGAAGLFTAPHLIVHLAKYIWSNSPQIVH